MAGFQEMGIVRCDACGEEFMIGHETAFVDMWVAYQQAYWLEKVLAEEHERDKKHADKSNCQADLHKHPRAPRAKHGSKINRPI